VPCYDPFSGASTGACELDDDMPGEPPHLFPTCCDDGAGSDLGTCVPQALVPAEQNALLGQDTCGSGELCAPTDLATGSYVAQSCSSWLDAEGRCLPACLPPVAAQASQLQDPAGDDCGSGSLCVPCFDQLAGESTGACELPGDAPADDAPVTFPTCCATGGTDRGTCVPERAAGNQASSLQAQECATRVTGEADAYLCAPTEKALDASFTFPECTVGGLACVLLALAAQPCDGACLPACFVPADSAALLAQDNCQTGELCAPCIDPLAGGSTGACE
jgi:hypothetical protein